MCLTVSFVILPVQQAAVWLLEQEDLAAAEETWLWRNAISESKAVTQLKVEPDDADVRRRIVQKFAYSCEESRPATKQGGQQLCSLVPNISKAEASKAQVWFWISEVAALSHLWSLVMGADGWTPVLLSL
jgi:hypothetical protein